MAKTKVKTGIGSDIRVTREFFNDPCCRQYLKQKLESDHNIKIDRMTDLGSSIQVDYNKNKFFILQIR